MDGAKSSSNWTASLTTGVRIFKKCLVEGSWIDFFFQNGKENILKDNYLHEVTLVSPVSLWNSRTKQIKCVFSKSNINQFQLQFLVLFCSSKVLALDFILCIWGGKAERHEGTQEKRKHGRFTPCCMSPFALLLYVSCMPCSAHR